MHGPEDFILVSDLRLSDSVNRVSLNECIICVQNLWKPQADYRPQKGILSTSKD